MGTEQDIKIRRLYRWVYNTVFGVLVLIIFVLIILSEVHKGAKLYFAPSITIGFADAILRVIGFVFLFVLIPPAIRYVDNWVGHLRTAILIIITLLVSCMCFVIILLMMPGSSTASWTHHDSLNYNHHRYHLDGQMDSKTFAVTYIVWECERLGIICRQIDSIEPEGIPFFLITPQLEIDAETNQLLIISEDQRYVVQGIGQ